MASNSESGVDVRIGHKHKAILHLAKSQIGMSDDAYRDMLGSFGVKSSVDLTVRQFVRVMDRLQSVGFKSSSKKSQVAGRGTSSRQIQSVENQKRNMTRKIGSVLEDMGKDWRYADGIARQMFRLDKAEWLEAGQLYKLLQALMVHKKRMTVS